MCRDEQAEMAVANWTSLPPSLMSNNARTHSELSNALQLTNKNSVNSIAFRSRALSNPAPSSSATATSFKAPAHKHAHHLHSIPPREKSTRTLIIDHLLWVHARTRFAQARCELGMTDRTGGPSSPHYAQRERPENFDEEDEVDSEGEDASQLKVRVSLPEADNTDRDDHLQNLSLAKVLRLRAEGVEKVVTSMLNQPPPIHPIHDNDDYATPPTSPTFPTTPLHKLPNGVRLRLALGTMTNDLFARQAPRKHHHNHTDPPPPAEEEPESELPPALLMLSNVASASTPMPNSYTAPIHSSLHPTERVSRLYNAGVNYHSANSPPSLRCPRHLHNGCSICVSAHPSLSPSTSKKHRGGTAGGKGGITGYQDECGVGSGLSMPGEMGSVLRRKLSIASPPPTSSRTRLSDLIPRFLRLSALVLNELVEEDDVYSEGLEPTRMWYLLLAGLLTRAVLEGYLTAGWRGLSAVQCLLSVGLSPTPNCLDQRPGESDDDDDERAEETFEDFEPDEMPPLHEAMPALFPSLRSGRMSAAEAEYAEEMHTRLQKFYDIPNTTSTPDLSTHMEDLAWYYPAEPMERAAVRFCEAVAKWRGKPELETYKSRPITIESLVHTSPQQQSRSQQHMKRRERRPPIEAYFQRPSAVSYGSWGRAQKRGRDGDVVGEYPQAKRVHSAL